MTSGMRVTLASAALTVSLSVAAQAAPGSDVPAGDLNDFQSRWHQCARDVYAGRSTQQSKAASQLSAFDACKEHEDAYAASTMTSRSDTSKYRFRSAAVVKLTAKPHNCLVFRGVRSAAVVMYPARSECAPKVEASRPAALA